MKKVVFITSCVMVVSALFTSHAYAAFPIYNPIPGGTMPIITIPRITPAPLPPILDPSSGYLATQLELLRLQNQIRMAETNAQFARDMANIPLPDTSKPIPKSPAKNKLTTCLKPASSAEKKAPDAITSNKDVPYIVDALFLQVYGFKIEQPEISTYWKSRARCDKVTLSSLKGAMQFQANKSVAAPGWKVIEQ